MSLCAKIGETTPVQELVYNGGRGKDMSHQESPPPERQQEQQQAGDREASLPDPKVALKVKRRRFTAKCKLLILEEADRWRERGPASRVLALIRQTT